VRLGEQHEGMKMKATAQAGKMRQAPAERAARVVLEGQDVGPEQDARQALGRGLGRVVGVSPRVVQEPLIAAPVQDARRSLGRGAAPEAGEIKAAARSASPTA
jgi:hypothetical protein